jgi:putative endonuclease
MFKVYVLYSPKHHKIYIGFTSDLENRMDSHNIYSKKGYTAKFRPWEIVFTEDYEIKKEATNREKQLKTANGREFIWEVVKEKYNFN